MSKQKLHVTQQGLVEGFQQVRAKINSFISETIKSDKAIRHFQDEGISWSHIRGESVTHTLDEDFREGWRVNIRGASPATPKLQQAVYEYMHEQLPWLIGKLEVTVEW